MKLDLKAIFTSLGWPLGLITVFGAVLAFLGIDLETVMAIAAAMVGAQAIIGLLVDVLKWVGVAKDGDAGKWSAGLNLFGIVAIAVGLYLQPGFDFPALDAQLMVVAQFLSLLLGYIVQVTSTKRIHQLYTKGLGVRAFSHAVG